MSKTRSGTKNDSAWYDELLKRIETLEETVKEQDKKITLLQEQNTVKSRVIDVLKKNQKKVEDEAEDLQQYGRRDCLRIHGVEVVGDDVEESADAVLKKVENIASKIGAELNPDDVYRAHRIGKTIEKKGKKTKQVIVKFHSWKARCAFYRARPTVRKPLPGKSFSSISVDLTKNRLSLLQKAHQKITEKYGENSKVFAFSDINCRLAVYLNDSNHYFSSMEDVMKIIQ